MINMIFYETQMSLLPNEFDMTPLGTDVIGTSCLVTDAAFKLKVMKCATESNNINQKSDNSTYNY